MSSQQLTDASAVLSTRFVGDVSGLEQAAGRSEAIVRKTADNLNAILSKPAGFSNLSTAAEKSSAVVSAQMNNAGSAVASAMSRMAASTQGVDAEFSKVGHSAATNFGNVNTATQSSLQFISQWGDGVSTSVRKFTSDLDLVPPSFSSVSTAAQSMGQTTSTALGSAAQAAATVGPAIAQSGAQAAGGLQSLASGAQTARSSAASLASQIASNSSAITNYSSAIANSRAELAQLRQRIVDATVAGQGQSRETQTLRGQYAQLSAATRGLIAEKGVLVNESKSLNTAMGQAGATVNQTGGFFGKLSDVLSSTTGQISSQGTLWSGYDAAVTNVARSFLGPGGLTIGLSLGITLLGTLADQMFKTTDETKKKVQADKESITANRILADSMRAVADGAGGISAATAQQVQAYRGLVDADITLTLFRIDELQKDLDRSTRNVAATYGDLSNAQRLANEGGNEYVITQGEMVDKLGDLSSSIADTQKSLASHLDALRLMRDVYGFNTEKLLEFAGAAGKTPAELERIERALNSDIDALRKFAGELANATGRVFNLEHAALKLSVALQQIRMPRIDVEALQGVAGAVSTLENAVSTIKKAGVQDLVRINAGARQEVRNTIEQMESDAAAMGRTDAQRRQVFKNSLADLREFKPELAAHIDQYKRTEEGRKAFSEGMKKAGGAASAARPMLNEFAAGLLGIEKAAQVVLSRMGDTDLFGNVTKKNRASVAEFKAASKELADAAEEMFRSMGVKVKVNAEQIATLGKDLAKPFLQSVLAFKTLQGAVDGLNFQRAAGQLALLDNEFKINGKNIELSITTYNALSQTVVSSLTKMGFTFKTVFPAANAEIVDFIELIKAATVASRDFSQEAQEYTKQWGDAVVRELERVQAEVPSYSKGIIEASKAVKEAIDNSVPVAITNARLAVQQSINSMIGNLEQLATYLGLQGEAWERYVEGGIRQNLEAANATLKEHEKLSSETIERIVEKWRKELVRLPGIWDEVFKDASASTRKNVDDILRIIDLIPGRVGDSLRKTESEFRRWYEMIDRTIRLIERALGEKETEGLLGVINNIGKAIGGLFKKTEEDAKKFDLGGLLDDIFGPAQKESGEAGEESGKSFEQGFMAKAAAIAGGLATFFGTRGQGRTVGVVGGALAGAQIGAAFGGAVGAGIGAAAGAIVGLFGTGQSEAEKRAQEEARKLEIERIRQDLARGYQELQQAVLETATRASALLESIIGRARVPKAEIQGFVKDMTRLLRMLVKELATIPKEVTEEIKVISENLLPSAELMAAMPQVFEGINQHMPMAESQARLYVNDWGLLTNLIGELAEDTPNKLEKQMRKFANRMMPVAELTITVSEGINAVLKTRPVSVAQFKTWAGNIDIILVEVSALEEKFDRYGVRKAAVFAENATKTFNFITEGSAAVNSVGDIAVITASDLAPFSNGINLIVTTISDLSRAVNSELVVEAQRFSQGAGASVTFMLETAQGFQELKDIDTVIPDTLRRVGDGVKLAVVIMAEVAREVDQEMRDDAEEFSASVGSVFTVITAAAGAFSDASTTRTLYPATMRAIGDGIKLAIVELARANREVSSEMRAEADAFAGGVTNIVTVIGTAGGAMRDLEPERFNVNGLIMLIGNIEEATRRTITLAKSIDKGDLALAVEFSINSQKIFDATAAGISIQRDMAGLEPISISQWDNWVLNVAQQTTALARAVDSTHQGMLLSAEFRSNTDVIRENVEAALSNILATATAAAGFLANSASYSFSIVSQGLQSSQLAPSAPATGGGAPPFIPQSGGGGDTYYVVNQYIAGHVLTDLELNERIEEGIERNHARGNH